jgi:hypothetical protein
MLKIVYRKVEFGQPMADAKRKPCTWHFGRLKSNKYIQYKLENSRKLKKILYFTNSFMIIEARCTGYNTDKVCQWLVTGQWFSPGTLVSSMNKADCHDITYKLENSRKLKKILYFTNSFMIIFKPIH